VGAVSSKSNQQGLKTILTSGVQLSAGKGKKKRKRERRGVRGLWPAGLVRWAVGPVRLPRPFFCSFFVFFALFILGFGLK
jgi:hypothetical protein